MREPPPISYPLLVCLAALCGCHRSAQPGLPALDGPGAIAAPSVAVASTGPATDEPTPAEGPASTGTLRARQVAALGPKEAGVISAIFAGEGDRVRRGQPLFRLDATQLALAVQQARAALASARVHARAARTQFERVKGLAASGAIPTEAFDQAQAQLEGADAAVDEAQAAVDAASHRVDETVVSSPLDGVVTERRMNVGELATVMPPSVVLVVQSVDTLELRARLPETALATLTEGALVDARVPSVGVTRTVKVERVAATVDPRTRTVEVVADVDNHDHKLRAGMLVEVAYGRAPEQAAVAVAGKPLAPRAVVTQ